MATYRTHVAFNVIIGYPAALLLIFTQFSLTQMHLSLFSGAFLLSTLFLSPDLDIAGSIKLLSLRGMVTFPFRPYAYLFSHRGISHMPIIGTLTRIAYIGLLTLLGYYIYLGELPSEKNVLSLWHIYEAEITVFIAGLMYADVCHLLLDVKRSK